MQQRQLRLGDILDDYCPRERRVTNHAVVAMVGPDVKQTRCTTCDAEHEYKQARVPRQRRKTDTPAALYSQVLAGAPKRVVHEPATDQDPASPGSSTEELDQREGPSAGAVEPTPSALDAEPVARVATSGADDAVAPEEADGREEAGVEDGPVHRPLIRATLPRPEGHPPAQRPAPEFTIRQPAGRPGRFRPRHLRGGPQVFHGKGSNGNMGGGPPRGGMPRQGGGRPPGGAGRPAKRHGPGRKRSK